MESMQGSTKLICSSVTSGEEKISFSLIFSPIKLFTSPQMSNSKFVTGVGKMAFVNEILTCLNAGMLEITLKNKLLLHFDYFDMCKILSAANHNDSPLHCGGQFFADNHLQYFIP
jgi:hypothetical protein